MGGEARGIAFIEFKDKESCDKAIKFDGDDYGGRRLGVRMVNDDSGKGKGKDGKDGKGKDKKGKKGKSKTPEFEGKKQTFDDSDDDDDEKPAKKKAKKEESSDDE